ncbi:MULTISPECIES: hypothetical protein [unclassified Paraburkholderia]|jgi:hypothetical protein|uniref:hypothetical protein n=1 Tax=unclassified Paraburkholderia TaxID=2615204 RepID=UPI0038BDBBB7
MATTPKESNRTSEKSEKDVDKAVEDTFPASDPAATSGTTRIESEDGEEVDEDFARVMRGARKEASCQTHSNPAKSSGRQVSIWSFLKVATTRAGHMMLHALRATASREHARAPARTTS